MTVSGRAWRSESAFASGGAPLAEGGEDLVVVLMLAFKGLGRQQMRKKDWSVPAMTA